jgi:hypothetical protein
MRAMRRAKRIIDVNIGKSGQRLGKSGIILLLFFVKAKIFEQDHTRSWLSHHPLDIRTDTVGRQENALLESFLEVFAHRRQAVFRNDFAIGPSQMGREHQLAGPFEDQTDRGEGTFDPVRLRNPSLIQGDVEIDAQKNRLILQVQFCSIVDHDWFHQTFSPQKFARGN